MARQKKQFARKTRRRGRLQYIVNRKNVTLPMPRKSAESKNWATYCEQLLVPTESRWNDQDLFVRSLSSRRNGILFRTSTHETQEKLNPPSAGNTIQQAVDWISSLELTGGTIIVLVSHSNVIPKVVNKIDPQLDKISIVQTESVVLRKLDSGFKCVARIPRQK